MEAVCRKHKKCHVTLFVLIWYVQIGSIIFLTLYHYHETHFCCPMLFCCSLNEEYSHCQIKEITGLSKGTVETISKELEGDKENHLGGWPSKLSAHDNKSIVCQITTEKLDNAVQATHSLTPSFQILSIHKQSEMHWRRLASAQHIKF